MDDLTNQWSHIDKVKRQLLIDTLRKRAVTREEGITLSGGAKTNTYCDVPGALRTFHDLRLAASVLNAHLLHNVPGDWTMIGGPMTGAIPSVLGLAMEHWDDERQWFIVRDEPKSHGLGRWYVGGEPGPQDKVVIVDDVANSGKSLYVAADRILDTGATILAVVPLVDRANRAGNWFSRGWGYRTQGIPYLPVLTYKDLDIPPLEA